MEQRRTQPRNKHTADPAAGRAGQAGFSLIEIMVVIAVMGVLTAAISVNWSSFIRHQELRQDAINLHKEMLALKARAIEQDTVAMITIPKSNANSYTIRWVVWRDNDAGGADPAGKVISLNKGVTITVGTPSGTLTGLPSITSNNWFRAAPAQNDSVIVEARNLNAFKEGSIVVSSGSAKARYCIIQKDDTGIRPELYYQSKENGTWTRM